MSLLSFISCLNKFDFVEFVQKHAMESLSLVETRQGFIPASHLLLVWNVWYVRDSKNKLYEECNKGLYM